MPSTNQLSNNSRSMNGLNTVNANAVYTDNLEVGTLTIDIQGTAPTRITGDNTTNIATTQFVQSAVVGAGSGYVDLTNNQTVGGIKTFSSVPLCSTAPTTGNMLTNKTYVDSVAGGAVSLSGNNTWTGINSFKKPVFIQDNSGNTGFTLTKTNQNITIVAGGGGSTQAGGSFLNAYNLNVPAGNNENQVVVSIPFDIYISGAPIIYPAGINVSLTITSVNASILKNGASYYGSSPTASYYNTSSLPAGSPSGYIKAWTGVGGVKSPQVVAYVGNITFPVGIDIANATTDTYQMSIKVNGTLTYTSTTPYDWNWGFATSAWVSFTSTNTSNCGGTFTYNNPSSLIPNSIIQGDNGSYIEASGNLFISSASYNITPSNMNFTPPNQDSFIKWTPTNNFGQTFDLFRIGTNANGDPGILQIMVENTNFNIRNVSSASIIEFSSTTAGGTVVIPPTTIFNLIPAGTIIQGVYSTAPTGYLLCNGASYSTTTYSLLFSVINYSYGGSGASFNVPDFRGAFLRGNGTQTFGGVSYTGGSISLAGAQNDQVLSAINATNQGFRSCAAGTRDAVARFAIGTDPVDNGPGILAQFPRQGAENRPFNYTVNFFIKY